LYRETSEKETKEIDNALICDSELQALYAELCAMKSNMDAAQVEPSTAAVLNILSYSQNMMESQA
jgi:hypothetical protein